MRESTYTPTTQRVVMSDAEQFAVYDLRIKFMKLHLKRPISWDTKKRYDCKTLL